MLKITVEERQSAEQNHTWQWKSFVQKRELAHEHFKMVESRLKNSTFNKDELKREIICNHKAQQDTSGY